MDDAPAEFWQFSLALYGRPGVAAACLALQDRCGLDVNLLLFCCWAGARGHRLAEAELRAALAAVEPWQREVVRPLRQIRRRLKNPPSLDPAEAARLYRLAKELELAAEEAEQRLLAAAVPIGSRAVGGTERAGGAAANLRLYLRLSGTEPASAAVELASVLVGCSAVFGLREAAVPPP